MLHGAYRRRAPAISHELVMLPHHAVLGLAANPLCLGPTNIAGCSQSAFGEPLVACICSFSILSFNPSTRYCPACCSSSIGVSYLCPSPPRAPPRTHPFSARVPVPGALGKPPQDSTTTHAVTPGKALRYSIDAHPSAHEATSLRPSP